MALSYQFSTLSTQEPALVTIPDDVSNAHRALKVLEEAGLIKLKPNVRPASPKDIIENPKNLQIKEIPGPQAIPTLPDVGTGTSQ
ncbi:MAG: MetQ/NlpA family ABC transporter substrate-binding protein [Gloeotrichia echinulata GP01]